LCDQEALVAYATGQQDPVGSVCLQAYNMEDDTQMNCQCWEALDQDWLESNFDCYWNEGDETTLLEDYEDDCPYVDTQTTAPENTIAFTTAPESTISFTTAPETTTLSPTNDPTMIKYCIDHICALGYKLQNYASQRVGNTDQECCEEIDNEYTLVGNGACESDDSSMFTTYTSMDSTDEETNLLCDSLGDECLGASVISSTHHEIHLSSSNVDINEFILVLTSMWYVEEVCATCATEIESYDTNYGTQCQAKSHCSAFDNEYFQCVNHFCSYDSGVCSPRESMRACEASDCSNKGTATGDDADIRCQCLCNSGWTGDNCSEGILCSRRDCNNAGDAANGLVVMGCQCTCDEGWTGTNCDISLKFATKVAFGGMTESEFADKQDDLLNAFANTTNQNTSNLEWDNVMSKSGRFARNGGIEANIITTASSIEDKDSAQSTIESDTFVNDFTQNAKTATQSDITVTSVSVQTPCDSATDCSGHGTTSDVDNSDGCTCACDDNWTGDASCSTPRQCDRVTDCSGNGSTDDNDATNGCLCTCDEGFEGNSCETARACNAMDCNMHGTTTDTDASDGCECVCEDAWTGTSDCSVARVCTRADCSDNGSTSDQDASDGCDCTCDIGFGGFTCDEVRSPTWSPTSTGETRAPSNSNPTVQPTSNPSIIPTDFPSSGPSFADPVTWEQRFSATCDVLTEQSDLFLSECSTKYQPAKCTAARCGSIIVTFEASSAEVQSQTQATIASDGGLNLPSFDLMATIEDDDSSLSTGVIVLIAIGSVLFAAACLVALRRTCKKNGEGLIRRQNGVYV